MIFRLFLGYYYIIKNWDGDDIFNFSYVGGGFGGDEVGLGGMG